MISDMSNELFGRKKQKFLVRDVITKNGKRVGKFVPIEAYSEEDAVVRHEIARRGKLGAFESLSIRRK